VRASASEGGARGKKPLKKSIFTTTIDFFGQITKTSNVTGYTIGKESDGIDKMNRTVI